MVQQVLSPGVEHSEEADLGSQVFRISGNGAQSFRSSPEEKVVHHFLVLESDGSHLFRQSEDNVEVFGIEELRLTILDPLGARQGLAFRAMTVATTIVGISLIAAVIALFQVAAQSGSAAAFDGTHDAELRSRQGSGMLLAISLAIATKHVSHFQLGAVHCAPPSEMLRWGRFGLQRKRLREQIEGTGGGTNFGGGDAQIAGGGGQTAMTE